MDAMINITSNDFQDSILTHFGILRQFQETGFPIIQNIVDRLSHCFTNHGKVLFVGNGGSAADCQHLAGEFAGRFKKNRRPLAAMSLAGDIAVLTCIANDYDYESVFSRQVEALGNEGDILWAFSTSGASRNVVKAAEVGIDRGLKIISFTGSKSSPLERKSDICLCAGTDNTAHAQEIHQVAYHIICRYLDSMYDEE